MFTAASAFVATNVDDIFILTLLFSRLDRNFRAVHVVGGQLIGFALLVLVSLLALLGRALLPLPWLGLLGLVPVSLGVSALLESWQEVGSGNASADATPGDATGAALQWTGLQGGPWEELGGSFWAPLIAVALLTMANGSDNIGVYLPLFARASAAEVAVTLITFAVGVGLWCLLAWQLTRLPAVALKLRRQGGWLVPLVLIALGVVVLADSHCLEQPLPAVIALLCLAAMALSLLRLVEALDPAAPLLGCFASPPVARSDDHRP
jgi:cadmium resistance protein CadD (predicted permease)